MWHHRCDEHRHGDVERRVWEVGRFGVHLAQRRHGGDLAVGNAFAGLRQHLSGEIDAGDSPVGRVVGQRKACTDAYLQYVAARELVHQRHCSPARQQADAAEHRVIDAGPPPVCGAHSLGVHGCPRAGAAFQNIAHVD
jgi:hypothetical protein